MVVPDWLEADRLVARLRAAGCVFAEDEAALLRAASASPDEVEEFVRRRIGGTPLEVVLGWAEFDGLRVGVDAGVFVPRQRTLLLVRTAAEHGADRARPVVVDLCCGTGAIGLAIAARVGEIDLSAADLEPAAVACARRNLGSIGPVYQGDLYRALPDELRGRVDVLAVNAPYVPTGEIDRMPPEARDHEPLIALDGGRDGLDVHRRVAAGAGAWLAPQGLLLMETSRRQASVAASIFTAAGLTAAVRMDDELDATVVTGARL